MSNIEVESVKTNFKWQSCKGHKPKELSYISAFDWAEKQMANGNYQMQCPICKHWYFKSEWGNVHPNPFKGEKLEIKGAI
jgi:hypothetical protein